MSAQPAVAANWYPDPSDPAQVRWWDGADWTDHVAPAQPVQAVATQDVPAFPTEQAEAESAERHLAAVPDAVAGPAAVPVPEAFIPVPTPAVASEPVADSRALPKRSNVSVGDPKRLPLIVAMVAAVTAGAWFLLRGEPAVETPEVPGSTMVDPAADVPNPAAEPAMGADPAAAPDPTAAPADPAMDPAAAIDPAADNGIPLGDAAELAANAVAPQPTP
jgi:hypothetical protein